MKKVKKTEIIIEADEVFVLRGESYTAAHVASLSRCAKCGAPAEVAPTESAARAYSTDVQEVLRLVEGSAKPKDV